MLFSLISYTRGTVYNANILRTVKIHIMICLQATKLCHCFIQIQQEIPKYFGNRPRRRNAERETHVLEEYMYLISTPIYLAHSWTHPTYSVIFHNSLDRHKVQTDGQTGKVYTRTMRRGLKMHKIKILKILTNRHRCNCKENGLLTHNREHTC